LRGGFCFGGAVGTGGGPERASRMVGAVRAGAAFFGIERGCVNWSEEIRRECGEELLRRGMFPPRKYSGGSE
jgi:hypothetical protein